MRGTVLALSVALAVPVQSAQETALTLRLNVPAYRLEARQGPDVVQVVRVAIGQRIYPTPIGRFRVTRIVWNPWWYPPPSPWAAHDTVTPPCPSNPVGRVKLGFGSAYFIHGTPKPGSIGRAASHGCVRTDQDDALRLAQRIVDWAMPESSAAVARHAAGTATRSMTLAQPVQLDIAYELAEVRADTLWMYPDVYRRMPLTTARIAAARRALTGAGVGLDAVADAELRTLVARARRGAAFLMIPARRQTLTRVSRSIHETAAMFDMAAIPPPRR